MEQFIRFTWSQHGAAGRAGLIFCLAFLAAVSAFAGWFFTFIAPWQIGVIILGILFFTGGTVFTVIFLLDRIESFKEFKRIEQRNSEIRDREIAGMKQAAAARRSSGW